MEGSKWYNFSLYNFNTAMFYLISMNERFITVSHFKYKHFYKSYTVLIFLNFEIVIALEEGEAAGRVVAGLARVVLLIG